VYDPRVDTWTSLPAGELFVDTYPLNFVIPNGRVLSAGPLAFTGLFDVATETWEFLAPGAGAPGHGSNAAMYRPGIVLRTGDSDGTVEVIDATLPSPAWRSVESMKYPRYRPNLVILPDGNIFAVGGSLFGKGDPECAIHDPEMWDANSETWGSLASMQRPRIYHSTAVLLPDGRILVAGGENDHVSGGERNAEIYSPPYLFKGLRPTVTSVPTTSLYGEDFRVDTPDAAAITSVVFMKPGATTHNFDQDQRYVPLAFSSGPDYVDVTPPPNANVAPPGYYMLFLINDDGVPSTASFILVEGDFDGDGVFDRLDNCPNVANGPAEAGDPAIGDQTDTDGDLIGNACDIDDDDDGLLDSVETNTGTYVSPTDTGTDPLLADSDGDFFPDGAEVNAGSDPNDPSDTPRIPGVPTLSPWGLAVLILTMAVGGWRTRRRS
jgi:hypothetical protein